MKVEQKNIEFQIFGDVSLNGLFCDPQYQNELQRSLKDLDKKIGRGDLRIINWEAPITSKRIFNPAKNPAIATSIQSAETFCNAFPFDVAALGNNHIGDCMEEGMDLTIDFLSNKKIETIGAGRTPEDAAKLIKVNTKGTEIGFLNFLGNETNPKIPDDLAIYVNEIKEETLYQTIEKHAKSVDFLFVVLHWGIEFIQYPALKQRQIAKKCIDSGAAVIIGHHSHCLQGMETYNEGLIFYSLGNFIFSGLKGKESFGWPKFCNRGGFYKLFLSSDNKFTYEFVPFQVSNYGVNADENSKSKRIQTKLSRNLKSSDFRYTWIYRINIFKNWLFRLPLFLIKTKGGLIRGTMSYFKIKYFKLLFGYFFSKK